MIHTIADQTGVFIKSDIPPEFRIPFDALPGFGLTPRNRCGLRGDYLVHAEETSWLADGRLVWLWVFTSTTITVFTNVRRSKQVLNDVLDAMFHGRLKSDGFSAYRDYDNHLSCLAHLLRKALGLEDILDRRAQAIGEQLRTRVEQLKAAVQQARKGPPTTRAWVHASCRAVTSPVAALSGACRQHA
jgi:hypothetical protein